MDNILKYQNPSSPLIASVENEQLEPAIITGASQLTRSFFDDFSNRYYDYHKKNIDNDIKRVLSKDVKKHAKKGNPHYNPITDAITLATSFRPEVYTHELTHQLNDSFRRIKRTKSEKKLLKEAYPLGDRNTHGLLYGLFIGPKERFTTNTELRRTISKLNNNVLGKELDDVILNMSDIELAKLAGRAGYNGATDYYIFPENVIDGESYYNEIGKLKDLKHKKWDELNDREKQWYNNRVKHRIGIYAFKTVDENKINLLRQALITVAKKGGRIHIKKKNRGKFTEYCGGKVTEECIAKGKNSKDPKIRKRATFAANARKWKHLFGGALPLIVKNIG